MKHVNKILALSALGLYGGLVNAAPIVLPTNEPLVFKFSNREQISGTDITTSPGGISTTENNWGVFVVDSLRLGTVTIPNTTIEIDTTQFALFNNSPTAQVTGMFYGATAHTDSTGIPLASTGGYVDLYWRDASTVAGYTPFNLSTATPAGRTGPDSYANVTDGLLLAHLEFAYGISSDTTTFIAGDTLPVATGTFQGQANSFSDVVMTTTAGCVNSALSCADLPWAAALNGDWFNVLVGTNDEATRDFRFNNRYNDLPSWSTNGFTGANSDDPATVFTAVPEPVSLTMLGLGLLGLGAQRRRKAA
jgi:hypothetical protein